MHGRLAWRESACPALLRSLTFVGAAVAILLSYRALDLPDESLAVTSVALVTQTQARASFVWPPFVSSSMWLARV